MKKILILGAGFLQSFAIRKARDMGYYVYALDADPKAVGLKYANEHRIINIVNQKECLDYAIDKDIDGVLNVANDYGVLTAAYISEKLSLPGIKYQTAEIIKNKSSFREKLFQNKVDDIKQYYEITNLKNLQSIKDNIIYPVIIKPSDGSGSRGITKVSTEFELEAACQHAMDESLINSIIIEDFIEGKEIGIESIVIDGKAYILGLLDKKMTRAPFYAELGHMMPSDQQFNKKIYNTVYKAIEILDIDCGAINMDALIDKENNISIIDIGARMGGNLIGSHIIPKSTGYDYLGNLIKIAVNDKVETPQNLQRNVVVTRLLDLIPGKILELPDINNFSEKATVYFNKGLGDIISPYRTNLDGCGYIVYEDTSLTQANIMIDQIKKNIDESVVRSY